MAGNIKIIALDVVAILMTVAAAIAEYVGFFLPVWWRHEDGDRISLVGMWKHYMCEQVCLEKTVLSIEGGAEWLFIARIFNAFGVFFCTVALLMALLLLALRRRLILNALIYTHGAAALFIFVGVLVFVGFHKTLKEGGSLEFPFGLCILGGILCIASAVITGYALVKHLTSWEDLDDDD